MRVLLLSLACVLADGSIQQGADDFQREGTAEERPARDALEWKRPPAFSARAWAGTDGNAPLALGALMGKVVVIAFWDETSPTCRRALSRLDALQTEELVHGLRVVAIHASDPDEARLAAFLRESCTGLVHAIDESGQTARAWHVDGYPDYQLIDRHGRVRVCDLVDSDLPRAIRKLLDEPPPDAKPEEVAASLAATWPEATYDVSIDGKPMGTLRLSQRVIQRSSRRLLELRDERTIEGDVVRTVTTCELESGLPPRDVAVTRVRTDSEAVSARLEYEDGKLRGHVGGRAILRNLPAPVVTDLTLLRLAATLPRKANARLNVQRVELEERDLVVYREERLSYDGLIALTLREGDVRRAVRVVRQGERRTDRWVMWFDEASRFLLRVEGRTPRGKSFVWTLAPVVSDD